MCKIHKNSCAKKWSSSKISRIYNKKSKNEISWKNKRIIPSKADNNIEKSSSSEKDNKLETNLKVNYNFRIKQAKNSTTNIFKSYKLIQFIQKDCIEYYDTNFIWI